MSVANPLIPTIPPGPAIPYLLSILSETDSEVAAFGYTGANSYCRIYENNDPMDGAIYGCSNHNMYFMQPDFGSNLKVGINTMNPQCNLHVAGTTFIEGVLTTQNLVVLGDSALGNITAGVAQFLTSAGRCTPFTLYNPTGSNSLNEPSKVIDLGSSNAEDRIISTVRIQGGRFLVFANIDYSTVYPSGTTDVVQIALYQTSVANFTGTETPIATTTFTIPAVSITDWTGVIQNTIPVQFYIEPINEQDYVLAFTQGVDILEVAETAGVVISIVGLGSTDSYSVRQALQVASCSQRFQVNAPTMQFQLDRQEGIYFTASSNVEVYRNGIKLVWYDDINCDYRVYTSNDATGTYYFVDLAAPASVGDIIDVRVWPQLPITTSFESGYLYQQIIHTPFQYQPFTCNWCVPDNSNIAIGTLLPEARFHIYNTSSNLPAVLIDQIDVALPAVQFCSCNIPVGSITVEGGTISYNSTSDLRLKTNVRELSSKQARDILMALTPKQFSYIHGGQKTHFGFIAQEVREVLPNIVSQYHDTGYLGVDYSKVVPVLTSVVQDLCKTIDDMHDKMDEMSWTISDLQNRISGLQNTYKQLGDNRHQSIQISNLDFLREKWG